MTARIPCARSLLIIVPLLALGVLAPAQIGTLAATAPGASAIEQGRYLVQAGNCISCHSRTGGASYAGGKAFQAPYAFLGTIYSTNITPDRETGLGAWSEADFIRAMRSGLAPGGKHLFPVFPYTNFSKLTTGDLKVMYAFLRTVPAVRALPPENSFWFRQRWAIALWNALFFDAGEFVPNTAQSAAWNRGYYLVEGLGHCGACHTPRNWLLAERASARLTGGTQVGEVTVGKDRTWSAPNLTAAASGLAKWTAEDLHKYLKTGHSRRAGTLGPMNEVIANSLQYLADDDITAMVTYIKSFPANGASPIQTLSAAERTAGQALYDRHCEECHLSTGRGGFRKAPPVAGSPIVQAEDPASLINVILYGAAPAPTVSAGFDAWEDMASFRQKLTDAEVAQLANYLRASWGNSGGRVTPGLVAAQR
jgi:mono/diheme cytochrome c family protein